jgi:hypothetical protein
VICGLGPLGYILALEAMRELVGGPVPSGGAR